MQALLVVDAQNEFSPRGLRPVPNHESAVRAILAHVTRARRERRPIAWIQHHNKPTESRAFVPGSWGAARSDGMGGREDGAGGRGTGLGSGIRRQWGAEAGRTDTRRGRAPAGAAAR